MISTHTSRKRAKLKRKQKSETGIDSLKSIFSFGKWIPYPPLEQSVLHEWAKELARTSVHSYSQSESLISTLWHLSYERLLIESVFYGRIE